MAAGALHSSIAGLISFVMLALVSLLAATASATVTATATTKWQWPGMENWSWDKISISTWGMPPLHRRFNESEIKFKLRFDVVFVDNTLQHLELDDPAAGCIVGSPEVCFNKSTTPRCNTLDECRVYKSSIAAPVKARQKKHQKTLGYRGVVIAWWNFVTKEHADWWLSDPVTGIVKEGVLDWRNKDAAAYFVDKVIGEATWTDTSMDGVFVAGRNRQGVQGAHLNPLGLFLTPLGLFLRTSIPFIWRILSVFLPA